MNLEQNTAGTEARHPERRSALRLPLDEDSVYLIVGYSAPRHARLVDLSLEGCRLFAHDSAAARAGLPVEVFFRVNGVPFRFIGVTQWTDGQNFVGIQFANVLPRHTSELAGVIGEMRLNASARTAAMDPLSGQPESGPPALPPLHADEQPFGGKPLARRDRRLQQRQELDTSATVLLVNVGSELRGRILDLSLNGCRIRTDSPFPVGIYTRVESEFYLLGLPFRLGGVIQSIHDRHTVGIRFLDLSDRKRRQLLELIAEIREFHAAQNQPPQPSAESSL